jgi:hypothetical protein
MGLIRNAFDSWLREWATPGVPEDGKNTPSLAEGRALGQLIDDRIEQAGSTLLFTLLSEVQGETAKLGYPEHSKAELRQTPPVPATDGLWKKVGPLGEGSWERTGPASGVDFVAGKSGVVQLEPADIVGLAGALQARAPTTRTISAGGLATGGGDLTANRTITVTAASAADVVTGTAADKAATPLSIKPQLDRITASEGAIAGLDGRLGAAEETIEDVDGRLTVREAFEVADSDDADVIAVDDHSRRALGLNSLGMLVQRGLDMAAWEDDWDVEYRFPIGVDLGGGVIAASFCFNQDGTVFASGVAASTGTGVAVPAGLFSTTPFDAKVYGSTLNWALAADEGSACFYAWRSDSAPPVAIRDLKTPINMIPSNGQSLDVGGGANDIVSVPDKTSIKVPPRPHVALSFNTGVRGVSGDGSALAPPLVQDPAQLTDFAPAYERANTNGTLGETPGTAMMRMIAYLMEESGRNPNPLLFRTHGRGGSHIYDLDKGTTPYSNGMTEVTRGAEIAAEIYKRPLIVHTVTWCQGPADRGGVRANYLADLLQLAEDYDVDVRTIIAAKAAAYPEVYAGVQLPEKIWLLVDQMGAPANAGVAGMPALADVDAMEQSDKITITAPEYMLQGDYGLIDEVHTKPLGADVKGEYRGLAWFRKVILREDDTCLWPDRSKIERSDNVIRVPLRGAFGKVLRNTDKLPPATNYGMEWTPASGSGVITDAYPDADGRAILIPLSAATGGTLRHAYSRQASAPTTGRCGAWGNFHDSAKTPSLSVPGLTLPNHLIAFDATVA